MAFDEALAERVRALLAERSDVAERPMFGGLTFMVSGRMCCGIQGDELIVRLGPNGAERALEGPHVRPMEFTGRPMRGSITVEPEGTIGEQLRLWVERAAAYAAGGGQER
jgi:TfoX/Sxy family transcriptional regulator of competence genes